MRLTLTVPDQFTADVMHTTAVDPPYPSSHDPSMRATRAEMAAMSLSILARSGAFLDIPMRTLATNLQLAAQPYPVVMDANVSIVFTEASENFTAMRSPQVDTLQATLLAFAEAAAFQLDSSLRAFPEFPDSLSVCFSACCVCSLHCKLTAL
jgi:hypothetical protein